MRIPLKRFLVLTASFALLGVTPAFAQHFEQGLKDPRVMSPAGLGPAYSGLTGAGVGLLSKKPEYGVNAGDFIIQPRLFLEAAYRSNFFRVDTRNGDTEGAMILHIRPGVALFNPQFDKVAVSLGLDVDVFAPVSSNETVTDQTNVGGNARLAVALFPKSALTLTLSEHFNRTLWMRPTVSTNANRNWNRVGADLSFHPGGRALDFTLGYSYDLISYDDLDDLDHDRHNLRFLASWRFYPMTYAFLEATGEFWSYSRSTSTEEEARPGNYVPGTPVKVYAGLSGYVTERLALLLRAGYGNSLLDRDPEDFSSFIGQLQASYRFGPKTVLHGGVARDFELTPLGGYRDYTRLYAGFTQRLGTLAEITGDFAYDFRGYGEWVPSPRSDLGIGSAVASDPERSESFIRAGVLIDFDVSRLFGVTVGYRYEGVVSDFSITSTGGAWYVAYDDHRVYASLNLRY
ncbi:MAG: hypothetical protein EP329_15290 [Deltaproteobacteria bacterium]|nr:MAG: hypothetical protein EP329_15290 [Deltaproteobacteria bacterium]